MVCGRDLRDAAAQRLDEIIARMDADEIADDELHPGQPNSLGRKPPPAEGGGGTGDVQHQLRARRWQARCVHFFACVGQPAGIDMASVAFGAGKGDVLSRRDTAPSWSGIVPLRYCATMAASRSPIRLCSMRAQ